MNVFAKRGVKNTVEKIFIYVILIFFAFMAIYPLCWLTISSFKSSTDYQRGDRLALPMPKGTVFSLGEEEKCINSVFTNPVEEELEAMEKITRENGLLNPTQLELQRIRDLGKKYDYLNPTPEAITALVAVARAADPEMQNDGPKSWVSDAKPGLGWTGDHYNEVDSKKTKKVVNGKEYNKRTVPYYSIFTLENYPGAWVRGNFTMLFMNSIIYTLVTTVAILYFSIAAGFAFSKLKNKATGFIYKSFIIGVLITLQCILIPLFFMAKWTDLYNTRTGILICYIGIGLPMGVYLATEFVRSIPDSLIESARIDGAQFLKIFVSIIFPMAKPVGVTLAILNIAGTWNEFMLVNILASDTAVKSLPVGVQSFSGTLSSDFGKQFAALVISIVPMIIFYIVFRKQITQGVAAGAVKG